MRLSEAIALGRNLAKPVPGWYHSGDNGSCALGMAERAIGKITTRETCSPIPECAQQWPWILTGALFNMSCPIGCGCELYTPTFLQVIAHIFDKHVSGLRDYTLEQLCDWVRSVEPAFDPSAETQPPALHEEGRYLAQSQEGTTLVGK